MSRDLMHIADNTRLQPLLDERPRREATERGHQVVMIDSVE
jgi:hypothetical protein